MKKRIVSAVMALILCLTLLPASALAAEAMTTMPTPQLKVLNISRSGMFPVF